MNLDGFGYTYAGSGLLVRMAVWALAEDSRKCLGMTV